MVFSSQITSMYHIQQSRKPAESVQLVDEPAARARDVGFSSITWALYFWLLFRPVLVVFRAPTRFSRKHTAFWPTTTWNLHRRIIWAGYRAMKFMAGRYSQFEKDLFLEFTLSQRCYKGFKANLKRPETFLRVFLKKVWQRSKKTMIWWAMLTVPNQAQYVAGGGGESWWLMRAWKIHTTFCIHKCCAFSVLH